MNEPLQVLLTATYPHELAIVRAKLEAEGIPCFLENEFTVQVDPLLSNAIGGVHLLVRPSDLEEARRVLSEEADSDQGLA